MIYGFEPLLETHTSLWMVQDVDVIVRDSEVILSLVAAKEYYIGCELEGPGVPVVYDEGPQICRPQHET